MGNFVCCTCVMYVCTTVRVLLHAVVYQLLHLSRECRSLNRRYRHRRSRRPGTSRQGFRLCGRLSTPRSRFPTGFWAREWTRHSRVWTVQTFGTRSSEYACGVAANTVNRRGHIATPTLLTLRRYTLHNHELYITQFADCESVCSLSRSKRWTTTYIPGTVLL